MIRILLFTVVPAGFITFVPLQRVGSILAVESFE
jgi:hypothetical protein